MKFIFLLILLFSVTFAYSQSFPRTDTQIWTDTSVSKSIIKAKDQKGKEFDKVSVFINGTLRFGNNVNKLIDERIGFGFDFKVAKFLTLTPSYLYRSNNPRLNTREYESRFRFAATLEHKWSKISIKDRNLIEYRMRNSRNDSTRYRNRFTFSYSIQKNKKELLAPFVADEVFYDFSAQKWTRNEISVGISKKFNKNLTTDIYYLRQQNTDGLPKAINVFGLNFKIKID